MTPKELFIDRLLKILVKQGSLTQQRAEEIEQAFHESPSDNFDDFMLDEGFVEPDELLKALSAYYEVPSFDVDGYFFDELLVRDFPKDVLLRHAAIPLKVENDILFMIVADPNEPDLATLLARYSNAEIELFVGLRQSICDAVKEFYDRSLLEEEQDEDLREEFELERDMHRKVDEEDESEG